MNLYAQFKDLKDASVFITGGGSGIGAALTEGFLSQGSKVAFVQRSDASDFVAEMEAKYNNKPLFMPCDITDIPQLKKTMNQAAEHHGTITILINNAANDTRHTLAEYDIAQWDQSINTNLRPYFFTAQHVVPDMKKIGYGAIINFSSIAYIRGNPSYPVYVTAKAAINGLTRSLARDLGPNNIRVNSLMPGWVLTERQVRLWADQESLKSHLGTQCIKRHLAAEDIVGGTLFLASKTSQMMTGQALVIDGGVVATG